MKLFAATTENKIINFSWGRLRAFRATAHGGDPAVWHILPFLHACDMNLEIVWQYNDLHVSRETASLGKHLPNFLNFGGHVLGCIEGRVLQALQYLRTVVNLVMKRKALSRIRKEKKGLATVVIDPTYRSQNFNSILLKKDSLVDNFCNHLSACTTF